MRGSDRRYGGVLPLIKPVGPTSHDMVQRARRWFSGHRVGHLGTLDPWAAGLLVLVVGGATRAARFLDPPHARKEYRAWVALGAETDTGDSQGQVVRRADASRVTREEVAQVLSRWVGTYTQVPPAHSAVLVGGERAYRLARKGKEVPLPSRQVTVDTLDLLDFLPQGLAGMALPHALVRLRVSRGTYVRALVRDVGRDLGVGAFVRWLARTDAGALAMEEALTWEEAEEHASRGDLERYLVDVGALLADWPEVITAPDPGGRVVGRGLWARGAPDGWVRLVAGPGRPTWCLAEVVGGRFSQVVRLLEEGWA